MVPTQLPDDVWIEIISTYLTGYPGLLNFASTSKIFRDICLPILYHRQTIKLDTRKHFRSLALANISQQIEFLLKTPNIAEQVRELRLVGMYSSPKHRATLDVVLSLLITLPHVRRLHLVNCRINPHLYTIIRQHPSLIAIDMTWCTQEQPSENPSMGEESSTRLEELSYISRPPDVLPCFIRLLQCHISTLTSLTIDDTDVEDVLRATVDNHYFRSLRKLLIRRGQHHLPTLMTESHAKAVARLLFLCPELRMLEIQPRYTGLELEGLVDNAVPNLESLSAESAVVFALYPGRLIHNVEFQTIYYTPVTSDVEHRFFTPGIALEQMQRNVVHLMLMIGTHSHYFKRDMKGIRSILPSWPKLRTLHLKLRPSFPSGTIRSPIDAKQAALDCPILPVGDPSERGHPSLGEIHFVGGFTWLWFPGEGWAMRDLDIESEREIEMDEEVESIDLPLGP